MVLCDLPYGVTANSWDRKLDFNDLWDCYKRIVKPKTPIVLFSQGIFTHELAMSNPKWYRVEWIWEKSLAGGFLNANRRPLINHENILVFSQKGSNYYPQMTKGKPHDRRRTHTRQSSNYNDYHFMTYDQKFDTYYPRSVIHFHKEFFKSGAHPTEKPKDLLQYLIRTYSQPGEIVLDNCMGCGGTCLAAKAEGRKYIGIEKEQNYFDIAQKRLNGDL